MSKDCTSIRRGHLHLLSLYLLVACSWIKAQSLAESGRMPSHPAITSQSAKTASVATPSASKQQSASPHLTARSGPSSEDVNRQMFEEKAGEDAGKLLLRSTPSGAEIFINDLPVGRTPLLMIIPPGKYKIDMLGLRQESGHGTVGVAPKETQTVLMNLNPRYPTKITLH
jgi:hypothetical protein